MPAHKKPRINKVCLNCGSNFSVLPSYKSQKYCSRTCYNSHAIGKNASHWKGGGAKKICPFCKKEFEVKKTTVNHRIYCSKHCYDSARRKRTPIPCPTCGKIRYFRKNEIKQGRKYCSIQCYQPPWTDKEINILNDLYPLANWDKIKDTLTRRSVANIHVKASKLSISRIAPKQGKPRMGDEITCRNCGIIFYQPPSRINRIFCSQKCSSEYMVGKNAPTWLGGKSFEPYPPTFNERFKRKIRQRDNFTCVICQKPGKHVHHINYIKDDTVPENCITLCISCHGKTNSSRNYWQNHFVKLLHDTIYGS